MHASKEPWTCSYTRCGNPRCHCAQDQGHEAWSLTFMAEGKRRVGRIPRDWVEEVWQRVEAGREFQDAVRAVLAANAQLLVLARQHLSREIRPHSADAPASPSHRPRQLPQ